MGDVHGATHTSSEASVSCRQCHSSACDCVVCECVPLRSAALHTSGARSLRSHTRTPAPQPEHCPRSSCCLRNGHSRSLFMTCTDYAHRSQQIMGGFRSSMPARYLEPRHRQHSWLLLAPRMLEIRGGPRGVPVRSIPPRPPGRRWPEAPLDRTNQTPYILKL